MCRARIKRKSEQAVKSTWPFVVMGVGAVLIIVVGFLTWREGTSGTRAASATPQVTGSPELSVDRDSIDFGKVPLNQTVRAEFKLKNVGDRPLRILGQPRVELVKGC
jgi:HYDIN/CFA65/VesB-like, Ig-like domain